MPGNSAYSSTSSVNIMYQRSIVMQGSASTDSREESFTKVLIGTIIQMHGGHKGVIHHHALVSAEGP